jgi:hypothetical protein
MVERNLHGCEIASFSAETYAQINRDEQFRSSTDPRGSLLGWRIVRRRLLSRGAETRCVHEARRRRAFPASLAHLTRSTMRVSLNHAAADGPGWIRTTDLGIKSPLLCQLSYRPARRV